MRTISTTKRSQSTYWVRPRATTVRSVANIGRGTAWHCPVAVVHMQHGWARRSQETARWGGSHGKTQPSA